MSTGQTLLTLGALVIFGYLALNVNRINLEMVRFSVEQQRANDSVHYGQSLVDRIYSTQYDLINPIFEAYNDIQDPDGRLEFQTQIGDTLYATILIQDQNNILLNTSGKIIQINVFKAENGVFNNRATYKVTIPEPE